MDPSSVNNLLGLLRSNELYRDDKLDKAVINNVVYYTARVRSETQLNALINSLFNSHKWDTLDILDLHDMSKGIFYWKLHISEPVIPLDQFYQVWDNCFRSCQSWTLPKLAIICGALETYDQFLLFQSSNFIDDSGKVVKMYKRWRHDLFLPIWCGFIQRNLGKNPNDLRSLVLLYSTIYRYSDNNFRDIPWELITTPILNIFYEYVSIEPTVDTFLDRNINKIVKLLQSSIPHCNEQLLSAVLNKYCKICHDLSTKELNFITQNKDYSRRYYSNILLSIVLSLKGLLESNSNIPIQWFHQILICLYYINFIAHDFGTVGFESYEYILQVSIMGLMMSSKKKPNVYTETIGMMQINIWINLDYQNKVNDCKLLFFLNFLELTIPQFDSISIQFLTQVIEPLFILYKESPSKEIREQTHSMILSAMNTSLLDWQGKFLPDYFKLSLNQYLSGMLSEAQIVLISQSLASRIEVLQNAQIKLGDIIEDIYSLIRSMNSKVSSIILETLIKCLIFQVPTSSELDLQSWLENILELIINTDLLDKPNQSALLLTLWDVITVMKSETALRWWYNTQERIQGKL